MRHGARFALLILLVGLVLGAATAHVLQPAPAAGLRHAVFDQYQRWQPRVAVDRPVRVVDIDEESLSRLGQWPWPRTRLAALNDRLAQAGAAAVGFDILFAEPDRTSPPRLAEMPGLPPALGAALGALPDHDAEFVRSLTGRPAVLGFAVEYGASTGLPPAWPFRVVTVGEFDRRPLGGYTKAIMPLPALASAAAGLGAISFAADADGIVRRAPMLLGLADGVVPSLDFELLRVAQRARNLQIQPGAGHASAVLRTGAVSVPVNASGELWLHYARAPESPYLPAWRVLAGEVPAAELAGSIVLVGSSAKGLLDLRFSPLGGVVPGVEIHAQALNQILDAAVLLRPWWAEAVELLVVLVGAAVVTALALRLRVVPAAAATLLMVTGICGAAWQAFAAHRLLLDPALPALTVLAVFITAGVARHRREELRQRWLRQAFARYVSPNLVDHLVRHPESLRLGGERRVCSFVFTDIAGYTRLIEDLDPAEAVGLLNDYLAGMVEIAFRHQGTLDRIVGDAVAVLFSAPLVQDDHGARALACALDLRRFTDAYAATLQARGIAFGHTRIGVHSGEVIVGNFGGSTMFDYRALGDPVNVAARLESANKWIGTRICISAAVRDACPSVPTRPVGRLLLQGKTVPLMAYEPLADGVPEDAGYEAAYALLAAGEPGALQAFERLAAARSGDGLVAFQCARLRAGERGDLIVLNAK
ncbi:adenylate/guanylate cyclase domain-containing protein [Azoarcus sp. DD4]|uniref:CHASE2 domain-containing protein n=1 Tax=Azoarcus sp. DD4 TaxID=2027405 RepID=UPI00112B3ADE|nr:adenylate/guanylate cyclase domain-containing protein [Azoarcus sp. DD4]QDF95778.1 adenylate/guanylate cyclase domain-containing protein [Azoarcus sp. DD4]